MKLFPPLFFVPCEGMDLLRHQDFPLNQNHPFSVWLIEHATELHEKYPGIFDTIRKNVSPASYALDEDEVADLNAAPDRLWALDKQLRPAERIRLKPEDFSLAEDASLDEDDQDVIL